MTAPQKEQTQSGGAGSLDALTGAAGEKNDNAIAFSRGYGRRDNTPDQRLAGDAGELITLLMADRAAAKGEQWISAAFGQRCAKAADLGKPHRCSTCVLDSAFLGLDIDGGLTAESGAMLVQIAQQGYRGAVYATASHTYDLPRYRMLLLLDQPLARQARIDVSVNVRAGIDQAMVAAGYEPPMWDDSCDRPEQPLYLPLEGAPVYPLEGDVIRTDRYLNAPLRLGDGRVQLTTGAFGEFSPTATFGMFPDTGKVVETRRHDDLLKIAGQCARDVISGGMSRDSVLVAMKHERDRGRWSRWMPDYEIEAALDGALEKLRSGEWTSEAANDPDAGPTLAQAIARELKPYTEEELLAALEPHPHIFSNGQAGIFPVGEVTVVAAPPRAGKTYGMVWLMAMSALGRDVVGLPSSPTRALIYSAEDTRKQYARKLAALRSTLSPDDAARVMAGVVVPDLEAPGLAEARILIKIAEGTRRPAATLTPGSIVEAVRPLTIGPDRYGVIVFETASTLSEADEDNPGMRMVSGVLKRVARELGVAVVLVHHTSQVAGKEIAQLNFSIYDIRGGTALPSNTRQCFLLLNLGSGDDPYPDKDGRTLLRRYLTQGFGAFGVDRITALIPLDASSQLADPPPVFLQWVATPTGPAMQELSVPESLAGASWRKVRQKVLAWGSAENQKAKRDQESVRQADDVTQVVDAVTTLHARGKAPTVSAVDKEVGRTGGWSQKRLYVAVDQRLITRREEKVPRVKDPVMVYRPVAEPSQQEGEGDFSE